MEKISTTRKVINLFSNNLKHWFELLLRKERFSEYINKTSQVEIAETVKGEISELIEELKKDNGENKEKIQGELKDVIYTLSLLLLKLENNGNLEGFENFGQDQKNKIFERSPNLKKSEKISLETEKQVWRIIKGQKQS